MSSWFYISCSCKKCTEKNSTLNSINFPKYLKILCFAKIRVSPWIKQRIAVLPFTLPFDAGWPQIWGPQDACCPIFINDLFDMHNSAFWHRDSGTALPKGGFFKVTWETLNESEAHWRRYAGTWIWRSEECKNLYRIESVENDADELETKIWARLK